MSEPIKPALSEKEWRRWRRGAEVRREVEQDPAIWVPDSLKDKKPAVQLMAFHGGLIALGNWKGTERQALAAAALDRQPFGFTWEDVETVREAIGLRIGIEQEFGVGDEREEEQARADCARFQFLADRIAALLPPQETP